jgi:hypothetical protein
MVNQSRLMVDRFEQHSSFGKANYGNSRVYKASLVCINIFLLLIKMQFKRTNFQPFAYSRLGHPLAGYTNPAISGKGRVFSGRRYYPYQQTGSGQIFSGVRYYPYQNQQYGNGFFDIFKSIGRFLLPIGLNAASTFASNVAKGATEEGKSLKDAVKDSLGSTASSAVRSTGSEIAKRLRGRGRTQPPAKRRKTLKKQPSKRKMKQQIKQTGQKSNKHVSHGASRGKKTSRFPLASNF